MMIINIKFWNINTVYLYEKMADDTGFVVQLLI